MTDKIVAVIPALNESRTIREMAVGARAHVDAVVIVDDGSTDDTASAVADLAVTLLRNPCTQGKASSLWCGMQWGLDQGASAIVTLDADGQHRPEDIPRLLAAFRGDPGRLILGTRVHAAAGRGPRLRRFANRFADFWVSWACGHWIADSQSGFRVYPATLLRSLAIAHDRAHGFVFESEALIAAARLGFRTTAVPIAAIYKADARPSHFRPVVDVARIVRMVAWKLISRGLYPLGLYRALGEWRELRRRPLASPHRYVL